MSEPITGAMPLPRVFGRYRLLRELGQGGMATVYLAEVIGPGGFARRVALKLVHPHLGRKESFQQLFLREARLGGLLSHPNVVQTLDFGSVDGQTYLVMELVEGVSLDRLIEHQRYHGQLLPDFVLLQLAIQLCRGLSHAHQALDSNDQPLHLVHRDLKPSNVLIGRYGEVKIADFGIARADLDFDLTRESGVIKGTTLYMSPEQAGGVRGIDHRSDLFTLGLILFEAYSLRPFHDAAGTLVALQRAQNPDVAGRLEQLPPGPLEPGLHTLLEHLLDPSPGTRFGSAEEVMQALSQLAEGIDASISFPQWCATVVDTIVAEDFQTSALKNASLTDDFSGGPWSAPHGNGGPFRAPAGAPDHSQEQWPRPGPRVPAPATSRSDLTGPAGGPPTTPPPLPRSPDETGELEIAPPGQTPAWRSELEALRESNRALKELLSQTPAVFHSPSRSNPRAESPSMRPGTDAASAGAAARNATSMGAASLDAASVGAASIGAASVEPASIGAANTGVVDIGGGERSIQRNLTEESPSPHVDMPGSSQPQAGGLPTATPDTAPPAPPLRRTWTLKKVGRAFAAATAALLFLVTARWMGGMETFDAWRHDLYALHLLSPPSYAKVAVVDLGDTVEPWPWKRQTLAALLERLLLDGKARRVTVDVVLSAASSEPEETREKGNARIAAVSAQTQRLVLAMGGQLRAELGATPRYRLEPGEPLSSALSAIPLGFAALLAPGLQGGPVRRAVLYAEPTGPDFPPVAWSLAARSAAGESPPRLDFARRRLTLDDHWIQTDSLFGVELAPVRDTLLPVISAAEVLASGPLSPAIIEQVRDKYLVLGRYSDLYLDRVATPWGYRAGVAVQATLLAELLEGQCRHRWGVELDILLQLLMLGSCAVLWHRRAPRARITLCLKFLALALVIEILAVRQLRLWMGAPILETTALLGIACVGYLTSRHQNGRDALMGENG